MLADASQPLVLADGTVINPETGKPQRERKFVEVPSNSEAQKIVLNARRSVADLPAPPKEMNALGLVAFYTLFGLSETQVAIALDNRLSVEQIKMIKDSELFQEFMQSAKENLLDAAKDDVNSLIKQHAREAAMRIVEHASSENDVLSFKASQDILDRAGHRPADVVHHKHQMEDALQIVVIKRNDDKLPTIDDAVFEEITDA